MINEARISTSLTPESIADLALGKLDYIHITPFYPQEICNSIVERFSKSDLYISYTEGPMQAKLGQQLYWGYDSPEIMERYYKNAPALMRRMRELYSPYISPIDKLRLELDDLWPHGATLACFEGKKLSAGLVRILRDGGGPGEPHQDNLGWHMPDIDTVKGFTGQIGANIYLAMPPSGGELQLWRKMFTKEENDARAKSYGIKAEGLPPPDISLSPEVGDLVLFNTRRLHCINGARGGIRVSVASFIGFSGTEKPLMFWS